MYFKFSRSHILVHIYLVGCEDIYSLLSQRHTLKHFCEPC